MSRLKLTLITLILCCTSAVAEDLYKYKDEKGKWVFSDKKPEGRGDVAKLQYKAGKPPAPKPRVYVNNREGRHSLVVHNPYYASVELAVKSSIFKDSLLKTVIPAASTQILFSSDSKIPRYRYKWQLGKPKPKVEQHVYKFPVSSKMSHRISQSFKGRFSHSKRPSIYAVDIATPVGTYISAARDGTVIWVKDDYHMGGRDKYFLDKANYVKVLHQDGTYAVYAHILLGSALVGPGDKVMAGDRLARAGSSGYSTGPHLHFVLRKNAGFRAVSIPFKFASNLGRPFTPQTGMKVDGIEKRF